MIDKLCKCCKVPSYRVLFERIIVLRQLLQDALSFQQQLPQSFLVSLSQALSAQANTHIRKAVKIPLSSCKVSFASGGQKFYAYISVVTRNV